MDRVTAKFIDGLVEDRRKQAMELVEHLVSYDKYIEVFARCAEMQRVIDVARHTFKGDEDGTSED